jgi:POT family proton-dependent oligopeptide transporter
MFKDQPKGLIGAALSNMGERFGFYIMMAILTLFISSKFGLSEVQAGYVYSAFYASIYLLALVGGFIADKTKKYKSIIFLGLILMAVGYLIIAVPTPTPVPNKALYLALTCVGLLVIAFGNGLFKGNLQAVVGQMYDKDPYKDKRESGFQIFYMFINVGGFFAPFIAIGVRNWWLKAHNFDYNGSLPELCHEYINQGSGMAAERMETLTTYANQASLGGPVNNISEFVHEYLSVFNEGFQYAFAAAIVAMIISMVIFIAKRKQLPDPGKKKVEAESSVKTSKEEIAMSAQEIRQRIYALFAVFGVVILFWLAFQQKGYSLSYFARDDIYFSVINI